jgi:hypothetical protein
MQDILFTNSLHITGPINVRKKTNDKKFRNVTRILSGISELTAMGHHQREGRRPLDQQIQAASLISEGHPTGLQGRIAAPPRYEVHHSC